MKIPSECFIGSATVLGVGAPEHSCRLLTAAEIVDNGVVRDSIWHLYPLWVIGNIVGAGWNWNLGSYLLLEGFQYHLFELIRLIGYGAVS